MSAGKKTVKILGVIVLLIVAVGVVLFMNKNAIVKSYIEKTASEALGVAVTIGEMDINLGEKKVVINDIAVANPPGYKNEHVLKIKNITVDGESFSKELLAFTLIQVDGTEVNLEVNEKGANLGDLKQNTQKTAQSSGQSSEEKPAKKSETKVIVRKFALTGAKITPSVTLLGGDMPVVNVKDIVVKDIGTKENGVTPEEAIAQIMDVVLAKFNVTASGAGLMEGMSLESLNAMGVSTGQVFKKNLKKSYTKEVDKFKKGLGGLKGMFE